MTKAKKILRAMWSNQSVSDKLWTVFSLAAFPIMFVAVWVVTP